MKLYRLLLVCGVLVSSLVAFPHESAAQAVSACLVSTAAPVLLPGDRVPCSLDTSGNLRVAIGGAGSSGFGTNTAAAPSRVEGSAGSFSFTLYGAARVSLADLLAGEDVLKDLIQVSGGTVRGSVGNLASGLLIAADCTSHCTPATYVQLPVGSKTFTSTVVSATSGDTIVKQTHTFYGANTNSATSDDAVQLCQIIHTATTQYLTKAFTKSCDPVTGNWLYYFVISSNTGSGAGVVTGADTATY